MFQDVIRETPFNTEAANAYFENIDGDGWNGDYTFISTMRALLGGRMGADDKVTLRFRRASYDKDYLEEYMLPLDKNWYYDLKGTGEYKKVGDKD